MNPSIAGYKYFMRRYSKTNKEYEFHLIFEYVGNINLEHFLSTGERRLSIAHIRKLGGQLISALKYLHDKNIIHQDLKPKHIILQKDL